MKLVYRHEQGSKKLPAKTERQPEMTEITSYYIISTEYVGPNPHENLDADRIEIRTEPRSLRFLVPR